MNKLNIFLLIALLTIIYSCGNGKNKSNEQKTDSLATKAEKVKNVQPQNQEKLSVNKQDEPKITLTVQNNDLINLKFAPDSNNTKVKIVSGKRDTTFTLGTDYVDIKYLSGDTTMIIYGNITRFDCSGGRSQYYDIESNIIALDVSKNTMLKSLSCIDNELKTLDISKNTELEELSCSGNMLEQLDISKNIALKTLYCGSNQLKSLNTSNNIALEYLICDENSIKNLDISKNTLLKELNCGNNELTKLNIANNKLLLRLNCAGNKISNIDVSANTLLNDFQVSRNEQLNVIDLSKNKVLLYLYWRGELTSSDIDKILEVLPDRSGLEEKGTFMVSEGRFNGIVSSSQQEKANKKNWKIKEAIESGLL